MQDVYFMNKETGELVPGLDVIREFYKTHGALDSWCDEWQETDIKVENSFFDAPNFSACVNI